MPLMHCRKLLSSLWEFINFNMTFKDMAFQLVGLHSSSNHDKFCISTPGLPQKIPRICTCLFSALESKQPCGQYISGEWLDICTHHFYLHQSPFSLAFVSFWIFAHCQLDDPPRCRMLSSPNALKFTGRASGLDFIAKPFDCFWPKFALTDSLPVYLER